MSPLALLTKAWNDSVWSKVIAAAITAALATLLTALVQYWETLKDHWEQIVWLSSRPILVPAWLLVVFGVVAVLLLFFALGVRTRASMENIEPNAVPIVEARAMKPPVENLFEAAPRKFYSRRNREDLANALTDLKEILNSKGDRIVQEVSRVQRDWDQIYRPNPTSETTGELRQRLDDLAVEVTSLSRTIHEPTEGFLAKYQVYAEEVNAIIRLPENSLSDHPFAVLQSAIGRSRDGISALERACGYMDDQFFDTLRRAIVPALFELQSADQMYRTWLDATRGRMREFQTALDGPPQ